MGGCCNNKLIIYKYLSNKMHCSRYLRYSQDGRVLVGQDSCQAGEDSQAWAVAVADQPGADTRALAEADNQAWMAAATVARAVADSRLLAVELRQIVVALPAVLVMEVHLDMPPEPEPYPDPELVDQHMNLENCQVVALHKNYCLDHQLQVAESPCQAARMQLLEHRQRLDAGAACQAAQMRLEQLHQAASAVDQVVHSLPPALQVAVPVQELWMLAATAGQMILVACAASQPSWHY